MKFGAAAARDKRDIILSTPGYERARCDFIARRGDQHREYSGHVVAFSGAANFDGIAKFRLHRFDLHFCRLLRFGIYHAEIIQNALAQNALTHVLLRRFRRAQRFAV